MNSPEHRSSSMRTGGQRSTHVAWVVGAAINSYRGGMLETDAHVDALSTGSGLDAVPGVRR